MTFPRTIARTGSMLALCLAAGAASLPSPALAIVYFVSNSGNDANTGTSPTTAWATISKANSRVAPGDIVRVEDGVYGSFPNPAASGTSAGRITYVGNLSSPGSVRITPFGTLSRSYITVKGFELTGGFVLSGTRDSIAFCNVKGNKSQITAADDCMVTRCNFETRRFWVVGSESDSLPLAERDTVEYCTFNLTPNDNTGHTIRFKALDRCLFNHLRFTIAIGSEGVGASCTKLFHVRGSKFVDCYWDVTNNRLTNADEAGWFVLRDMTLNNSFVRDTVILRGPGPVQFLAAASGTYPGTVLNNNWESCVFRVAGPLDYDYAIYYQDKAQSDTLRNCVIVSNEGALYFNGLTGQVLIDHCTFAGFKPTVGVLNLSGYVNTSWEGNLRIENTLFYTALTAPRSLGTANLYTEMPAVEGHFTANYNLYYGPMRRDSTIYASGFSPTGPGATSPWCTSKGLDCASVHGDPKFTNASSPLSFDPRPLGGSWAIGTGIGGTDIGALPFLGPDTVPPSAASDVAVAQLGDNYATLQWTAPGDDGVVGRASTYDIRRSNAPINATNFGTAAAVNGAPAPQAAGSLESFTVSSLAAGQTYYFAFRARDEAGNWSAVSNVPSALTHASDITPPASIRDLKPGP